MLFTNFYKISKIVIRTSRRLSKQFHRYPAEHQGKFGHSCFVINGSSFYWKQKLIPNLDRLCSCNNSIVRSLNISKILKKFFLQSCAVSKICLGEFVGKFLIIVETRLNRLRHIFLFLYIIL